MVRGLVVHIDPNNQTFCKKENSGPPGEQLVVRKTFDIVGRPGV